MEVVGINSRAAAQSHAHLLKYDSTYGVLNQKIDHGEDYVSVNSKKIKVFDNKDPGEKVLKENFGLLSGQMTTIHALTRHCRGRHDRGS